MEVSNLRIIGMIVGVIGIIFTFSIYRGAKWKRLNFILFNLIFLGLFLICVNPDILNALRDIMMLQGASYGRIIALLVISVMFLFFYSINTKSKLENLKVNFDRFSRGISIKNFKQEVNFESLEPVTVIIPAYNESENLEKLLPAIPSEINGKKLSIVVVDDGSTDSTKEVVEKNSCYIAHNIVNRGQGAVSRLGYDILFRFHTEIGVTMDGDLQHSPDDIEKIISPILEDKADFVLGSRMMGNHERVNVIRSLGIRIFSFLVSMLIGHKITDCSSGFKAFKVKKLESLHLAEDQFQSTEILIEAAKKGLRIIEVPIYVTKREFGYSKKGGSLTYGFNFFKIIFKTWWRK